MINIKGLFDGSPKAGENASEGGGNWTTIFSSSLFGGLSGSRILTPTLIRKLYKSWVFVCLNARREDIGNIDLVLYRVDKKGETLKEEKEHELLDLLYSINEGMTKNQAFGLIDAHERLFGEAYWKVSDDLKRIIPMMPDELTPYVDNEGVVIGWDRKYMVNGLEKSEKLRFDQVVPFRDIDPLDLSHGQSTVGAIYDWIETEINATEWNRTFFKNNAVPPVVFESEVGTTKEKRKRFLDSFREEHLGVEKAHKVGVLPPGMKMQKLADGHKDMDFEKLDERFQNKILSAFGVPRTRIGITDDVNRANAEATNYVYALRTVKPVMQHIVDTLNEFLVPKFGDDLVLGFKSPVPEDVERELKEIEVGCKSPFMSVNEARTKRGLAPIEGGDEIKDLQGNVVGRVKTAKGKGEVGQKLFDLKATRKQIMAHRVYKHRIAQVSKIAKEISEGTKTLLLSLDIDEIMHKAFVARVEPFVEKIKKGIQEVNAKAEEQINAKLEEMISQDKSIYDLTTKDILESDDEMLSAVVSAVGAEMYALAKQEGKAVLDSLNITGDFVFTDAVKAQMDEKIQKLAKSYSQTTVDLIKSEIERGLADGIGLEEIRANIKANVFDYSNDVRAEMIANTETFRIANLATRDAYSQSGVVETVKWYTAEDERVCEFCGEMQAKNDGQGAVVGVDEPFFKLGDVLTGSAGGQLPIDYDDVMGGALHVNCRCYTRPEKITVQ